VNSSIDTAIINAIVAEIEARSPEKRGREVAFLCPAHNDRHPSARWSPTKHTWYCDVCSLGGGALDLARRLGIPTTKKSTVNARRSRVERGPVVAQYVYTDEHGAPLYRVDRHDPKAFLQYRALPDGSFTSGLDGVTPTIFRLPRVLAAVARADRIFIVEGEKDVLALEAAGVTATCNSGGAGKWRPEFSHDLRGADVTIVRDRDEVGHQHARDVADSLAGIATSVTIVEAAAGKDASDHLAAGHSVDEFVVIEDVAAPPSLAEALDAVRDIIRRFVAMPSEHALDAVTLWIAATHAQTAWEHASRLVVKSPVRRCGKTRLLEIVSQLVHRPLRTANISAAALVRSISDTDPPTLILDEQDAVFARRRGELAEKAEDLRGIINAGYGRDFPYIRWNHAAREAEQCPTFAMVAIAAIGDLPDTVEDRAVVVTMRRRAEGERVQPLRARRARKYLEPLRADLGRAVRHLTEQLADAEPDLPVDDRAADVWEPLVAIADAAGGDWPSRARGACAAIGRGAEPEDDEPSVRLLADLRVVFGEGDALATTEILGRLKSIDDAPWADWARGSGLTPRGLAALLRPYGVKPAKWSGGTRGYRRDDLADAWARYARSSAQSATPATLESAAPVADGVADGEHPSATPAIRLDSTFVADGADGADERLNRATPDTHVFCVRCGAEATHYGPDLEALCDEHGDRHDFAQAVLQLNGHGTERVRRVI